MGLPSSPYNSTASFANLSSTSQQYNPYAPSPVNDNNRGLISQNYNNVDVGAFNKNMGIDGEEEGGGGEEEEVGEDSNSTTNTTNNTNTNNINNNLDNDNDNDTGGSMLGLPSPPRSPFGITGVGSGPRAHDTRQFSPSMLTNSPGNNINISSNSNSGAGNRGLGVGGQKRCNCKKSKCLKVSKTLLINPNPYVVDKTNPRAALLPVLRRRNLLPGKFLPVYPMLQHPLLLFRARRRDSAHKEQPCVARLLRHEAPSLGAGQLGHCPQPRTPRPNNVFLQVQEGVLEEILRVLRARAAVPRRLRVSEVQQFLRER